MVWVPQGVSGACPLVSAALLRGGLRAVPPGTLLRQLLSEVLTRSARRVQGWGPGVA